MCLLSSQDPQLDWSSFNPAASLNMVADHVRPFMTPVDHLLMATPSKMRSHHPHTGFWAITVG